MLESRDAAERRGASPRGRVLRCAAARGRANETVESVARVLRELGDVPAVMTSACGTWVDRGEAAALRRVRPQAIVSSIYGCTAEHFSAAPLLAAAAVLLGGGRLPRMLEVMRDLRGATGDERPDRFAAVCTDFTGCVSGAIFAPTL